jgi:amino acid transporter
VLKRGINRFALFATMFVVLCGGPFGMEEIVPLAGPGLFALTLLVVPVLWGIPYALITAELVSELPMEGGAYQWFRAGLGPFWSFIFTYLEWISWVLDSALYPALLAGYLMMGFFDDPSPWMRVPICLAVIWGCAWLNIRGVKEVGIFSTVMLVVIMAPVIAMVLLAIPKMSLAQFSPLIPEDQSIWDALKYGVIWAIWSYSGYDGLAAASEEIVEPERNYPKVLAVFIPISIAAYVLPLWAGLAASPDWQAWGPAHLTISAGVLGGTLLATLMAGAGQVAALGLYNGEQLILARFLYAMSRDGMLPPILARLHARHQTPHVSLIFHALLFSVLSFMFDFIELLVLGAIVSVPVYIITFVSPLILRWKYPNLRGPFRIPGGWLVLVPITLLPSALALYLIASASRDELLGAIGFIVVAPLFYWAARWYNLRHGITTVAPSPVEVMEALERGKARPEPADGETERK